MKQNIGFLIAIFAFLVIYNIYLFNTTKNRSPTEKSPEKTEEVKEPVKRPEKESLKESSILLNIQEESPVFVETPLYQILFDKKTGTPFKIVLKKFYTKEDEPLELYTNPVFFFSEDTSATFTTKKDTIELESNESAEISFTSPEGDGEKQNKSYRFFGDSYRIEFSYENIGKDIYLIQPSVIDDNITELIVYEQGKHKKHNFKNLEKTISLEGEWFALKTKYFVTVYIRERPEFINMAPFDSSYLHITTGENSGSFSIYIGPLDYGELKATGYDLESLYPAGWSIIKPFTLGLLYIFRFLGSFLKNFGIVIIVFSLLMKVVFMPLTMKSLKSMQKMQNIQPRLKALQKAYKDDPKKLQEETFRLYKDMGVNPFSGCLPLIIQLPIFWALYQILRYDIMLRGSPFVFWIQDLSLKDPFYILPVLMGGTSILNAFLQPQQQKQSRNIGLFMAAFITIIFLNFPSGLVLYWLFYNIWGIMETLLFKQMGIKK